MGAAPTDADLLDMSWLDEDLQDLAAQQSAFLQHKPQTVPVLTRLELCTHQSLGLAQVT